MVEQPLRLYLGLWSHAAPMIECKVIGIGSARACTLVAYASWERCITQDIEATKRVVPTRLYSKNIGGLC